MIFFKHILKILFSTCTFTTFTKAQVNRSVASYFRKSMIDPIYSTEAKNTPTSLFPQKEITILSLILLDKHFLADSCIKLLQNIEKLTNFRVLFIILVSASKRTKVGGIWLFKTFFCQDQLCQNVQEVLHINNYSQKLSNLKVAFF